LPKNKNKTIGQPAETAQVADETGHKKMVPKIAKNIRGRVGATLEDEKMIGKLIKGANRGSIDRATLAKIDGRHHRRLANRLIENGNGQLVAINILLFKGLDPRDYALPLIRSGSGREYALSLIKSVWGSWLVGNFLKFKGLDPKEFALMFIEAGLANDVAINVDQFKGIDQEVALKLIDAGQGRLVASRLRKFKDLDEGIALRLIDVGETSELARNLDCLRGLGKEVADKLIKAGEIMEVANCLLSFRDLDKGIALKVAQAKGSDHLLNFIQCFRNLDDFIALAIIGAGQSSSILENLKSFHNLSNKTALALANASSDDSIFEDERGSHAITFGLESFQDPESAFGLACRDSPGLAICHCHSIKGKNSADRFTKNILAKFIFGLVPDLTQEGAEKQAEAVLMCFKGAEVESGGALAGCEKILEGNPSLWPSLFFPTIMSQKLGSFLCLQDIEDLSEKDDLADGKTVNLIKFITTQTGIKAHDILKNFILVGLHDKRIQNLSEESDSIREFIQSDAIPLTEIYEGYKAARAQNKPELYREIVEVTRVLQKKIADGTCEAEDFGNRFFPGIVMYTFPPAIGVEREQYANLIGRRKNRQNDVPKTLDPLQNHAISIASGGYRLKEGEELDTGAWNSLLKSVEEGKKTESKKLGESDYGNIGKEICLAFSGGRLKSEQEKFLGLLYRVYQGRGQSLPDSLSGHRELMAYKEYVGDTLNDLIGLLLQAWEKGDPKGFEEWHKTEIQKRTKDVKGLTKQIAGVLKNDKMDEAKKIEVLKSILARAEFQAEGDIVKTLTDELEKGNLEEFLKSKLEGKGNAQKFNLLIKNALLGKEYSQMYGEMQKYEFAEGAEKQEYKLFVSKKKEHGCAGLNMGACVAPDKRLWENPNFMNVIAMKDSIAYGGMHFLVVEKEGKKYLTLPGINPNEALLGQAAAEPLFDALMDYAKQCADAMGCEKVLIPKNTGIHSNRSVIQEIIASRNYPTFDFGKKVPFSYDPYQYSFQECFEVTE